MKVYGFSIRDTTSVGGVQLIIMEGGRPADSEYVMQFKLQGLYRHWYVNSGVGLAIDKRICVITPNEGR